MGILRKLFCIPPRERKETKLSPCKELLASASEHSGWIDTTSVPPVQHVVPPLKARQPIRESGGLIERTIAERKCKGCKAVTEIVQRWSSSEAEAAYEKDRIVPNSFLFIQSKSKKIPSTPFQKGIEFPMQDSYQELKDQGFEKKLEVGDAVDARYSKCIATVNCSFCRERDTKYFLTALCQKNEKVGGVRCYLDTVYMPRGYQAKPSAEGTTSTKAGKDDDGWSGKTF